MLLVSIKDSLFDVPREMNYKKWESYFFLSFIIYK